MKYMKSQLIQLLKIQAPSGQEHKVVKYTKPILEKLCDKVWVDHYGNLLAEKVVGSGEGATVILSAHMDSVSNIQRGRKVVEKDGVFSSTKGVLGADDRAGMAIILAVLRNIEKTGFDGVLKLAFPREEEIGCVGSGKINPAWIQGADLAMVVDRRGNNDIVVGNFYQAFCSTEVGKFFQECSEMLDSDWEPCEGGISDACTYSELGVHSVNLSAGYMNEHMETEYVVFEDMKKTVNLMLQSLALINDFAGTFGEVPKENEWIKSEYAYEVWNDDDYNEWAGLYEGRDRFGTVTSDIYGDHIQIKQKWGNADEEIFITKDTFEKIVKAYYAHEGMGSVEPMVNEEELPFEPSTNDPLTKEYFEKHGNLQGAKL